MHTEQNTTIQAKNSNKLNPCGFLRSIEGVQEVVLYDSKSPPRAPVVNSYEIIIKKFEDGIIEDIVNANNNFTIANSK